MIRSFKICHALREKLAEGYSRNDLVADVMAGVVVALIALPLAMALAIASGVSPEHGLYTIITAGFLTALFGGSRCQVTGPTAAFVVLLMPIVHRFGLSGLLLAGFMAGILLIVFAFFRLGKFIEFIPHPVITGFTSGIAIVIATIQFKDFFGLKISQMPESFSERMTAIAQAMPHFSRAEFLIGFATLIILIAWPRGKFSFNKNIPAPLVALTLMSFLVFLLEKLGFHFATIESVFHGIPKNLPSLHLPWVNSETNEVFNFDTIISILPSAISIALLAAVESLLSAVVGDSMANSKHEPNAELFALGVGNLAAPFFGGIAATGAIARTATNIKFGARSPIAAMVHSAFVFICLVFLAPLVSYLPMASLAALLLMVAFNMSEYKKFIEIVKEHPKTDVLVLVICFALTILYNMVVGVAVGLAVAFLLHQLFRQRLR